MSDKMMEALEPCPFCGSRCVTLLEGCVGSWFVRCDDCRASGNDMGRDRAVSLWNARATPFRPVSDGTVAVPAAWGRVIDGTAVTVSREWTRANNEPLYTAPPSVVDFLKEWTGPEVIGTARLMAAEWQKRYGWDKGEHEGCGRDSERAFKKWAASPAAGREEACPKCQNTGWCHGNKACDLSGYPLSPQIEKSSISAPEGGAK